MKKFISLFLTLFLFIGCTANTSTDEKEETEYACDATAECDDENGSSIDFTEISMDEALAYFEDGKSGILFFGFESCPWCQEAKPILKDVADETGQTVYYVKVRDEDSNLLYTEEQRELLTNYIGEYMSENEDQENKLWLYVPLVVSVKNGVAIDGHVSTIDGHDATEREMTDDEKAELKEIYKKILEGQD